MQIILLEHLSNLGKLGEVVSVKNGYARNYLLPKKKAIRATEENKKFFEERREEIEKEDAQKKVQSEKVQEKINGTQIVIVRQAGEDGRLYGSVTTRDIATALSAKFKEEISSNSVIFNTKFKEIGIYNVDVLLHAEVKASIQLNIARSEEEARAVGAAKSDEESKTAGKAQKKQKIAKEDGEAEEVKADAKAKKKASPAKKAKKAAE